VNVKEVEVVTSDADLVQLRARPNFRSLGRRYGKRTPEAAAAVGQLTPDQLRQLESGSPVSLQTNGSGYEFLPEDVTVDRDVATEWLVQSAGSYVAALDPTLTEELRREGLAREVVNRVQRLRKEAGYEYTTRIALWVDGPPAVLEAVRAHADYLAGETLARGLRVGESPEEPEVQVAGEIDDHSVVLAVARWTAGRPESGRRTERDT